MANTRDTLGYQSLALRAANQARNRALVDQQRFGNDSGSENDIGGTKGLGLVQGQLARDDAKEKLGLTLAAKEKMALALKKLSLDAKEGDPLVAAKIANYESMAKDRESKAGDRSEDNQRDEAHFQGRMTDKEHQDAVMNAYRQGMLDVAGRNATTNENRLLATPDPITGHREYVPTPGNGDNSGGAVVMSPNPIPEGQIPLPKAAVVDAAKEVMANQTTDQDFADALGAIEKTDNSDYGVIASGPHTPALDLGFVQVPPLGFGANDIKDFQARLYPDDSPATTNQREGLARRQNAEQSVGKIISDYANRISGKAVNEQEAKRLFRNITGYSGSTIFGNSKEGLKTALNRFREHLQKINADKASIAATGTMPDPRIQSTTPAAQEITVPGLDVQVGPQPKSLRMNPIIRY